MKHWDKRDYAAAREEFIALWQENEMLWDRLLQATETMVRVLNMLELGLVEKAKRTIWDYLLGGEKDAEGQAQSVIE